MTLNHEPAPQLSLHHHEYSSQVGVLPAINTGPRLDAHAHICARVHTQKVVAGKGNIEVIVNH